MRAQLVRDFAQDPEDLALFFFMEANEFVVKVDRFKRFDKQRLSAAARPMDNSVDATLLTRNHRDDEPIVSNRYVFFLEYALVTMGLQESLK